VTDRSDAARRVRDRVVVHARGAAAHLTAMVSPRFEGGVDPIDVDQGRSDGTTLLTGWVRTRRAARLTSVIVFVDGEATVLGRPNPDDPRAGVHVSPWHAAVTLPPGQAVMVHAVALCSDGGTVTLDPQTGRVPTPEPPDDPLLGNIDLPRPGAVVGPTLLTVAGWTLLDPIARVEVGIDGAMSAARQMATPRPDVARLHQSVHASLCGFEHVLDLTDCVAGEQITIVVEAVRATGTCEVIDTTEVVVGDELAAEPFDQVSIAGLRAQTDRVAARHVAAADGVNLFVVTHDLGLGGGQLYLHELLLRLLDAPDVRCFVVSPTDGPLRDDLEALGVEVHICGPFPTEPAAHESLLRLLCTLAGEFEATAVVANTAGAACGVEVAERLGIPSLWAIHESYAPHQFLLAAYGPGGAHPSAQDRLEHALASASAVIFEADATRLLYCESGDPRRFVHIPYGIPLSDIDAFMATDDRAARRRALGWTDHEVVILCVGTFEPRKAQASLLRAFAQVSSDHPEAVLVLVGDRSDPYSEAMRAYAVALDLGDRVRIEAVTPALFDWYATADLFVLASDVESLPRSVLEAMAFGVPPLVAPVFGLGEIIRDGDNGMFVAPRDLVALDAALRRALSMSSDERRAMGARAATYIRANHDSRGYGEAYRTLLDGFAKDPSAFPGELLGR
jgi:glycosyltransferase involved in cell wall biosynthesis